MKHLPTYTDLEVVAVEYLRGTGLGVVHRPQLDVDTIRAPDGTPCAFPSGEDGRCLDDIDWQELGRWLGHLSAWIAYARHLVGVNGSIRVSAEAAGKQAESVAYMRSASAKVTDRRADAAADPLVARYREIAEEAHSRDRLLVGRLTGLEQMYQAISREQSRREGEHRESGPTGRRV